MPKFKSAHAYEDFAKRATRRYRYIHDTDTQEFFAALIQMAHETKELIPLGRIFWRAQIGHDWDPIVQDGEHLDDVPGPFNPARMAPRGGRSPEGRSNPKGIPYLYVATRKETAMSEVRPWIGSLISVAQFKTVRDLTIANVTIDDRPKHLVGRVPDEERDAVVWYRIDEAFSEPVTPSDDLADYAPTQTIAELFKLHGFDGIGYRSSFGGGMNAVFFDIGAAKLVNCSLYEVENIEFKFKESANPYFVSNPKGN